MAGVDSHWHGLSCFEIKVNKPFGPTLFRQLGDAARRLRESGLADGAVSSYGSIAVYWNQPPAAEQIQRQVTEVVLQSLDLRPDLFAASRQEHTFDVRYDGEDLDALAEYCALSAREVIERHSAAEYVVAAVGFMPHFAYLWGLDPSIASPRRMSPRVRVPIGSLGIAGQQTGIYPAESPGGWQLIGRVSPDACKAICPQMKIGDIVRFREIRA